MPWHRRAAPEIRRAAAQALSLVVPPRCGVCGAPCESDVALCHDCEQELIGPPLEFSVPGIDAGWAATDYDGVGRRLVAALKFDNRLALARAAAAAMAAAAPGEWSERGGLQPLLVPVPASPRRERMRGFDSAYALARLLMHEIGLGMTYCLERRDGPRQVGRSRAERLAGPQVFCRDPAMPSLLLVDDVVTTGATLAACAAALRHAGCERVLALTFARA
jgi:ComF family protein